MKKKVRFENYMPILEEAVETAVKAKNNEDGKFVLDILGKCYITGGKFICPYEDTTESESIGRMVVKAGNKHFLFVFTSLEEALKSDCIRVMESPVGDIVSMVCELDDGPKLDGLAINLYPSAKGDKLIPYLVLSKDLCHVNQNCKTIIRRYMMPPMMQSRSAESCNTRFRSWF